MDSVYLFSKIQEITPGFEKNLSGLLLYYIRNADDGLVALNKHYNDNREILNDLLKNCTVAKNAIHKVSTFYYVYKLHNIGKFNFNLVLHKIEYSDVGKIIKENNKVISDFLVKSLLIQNKDLKTISESDFISLCDYVITDKIITNIFEATVLSNKELGIVTWSVLNYYKDLIKEEVFNFQIKRVRDVWCKKSKEIALLFFNNNKVELFEQTDFFVNDLTNDLDYDLNILEKVEHRNEKKTVHGVHSFHKYIITYYGGCVRRWLESDTGPRQYNLCTNVQLLNCNYNKEEIRQDSGCVIEGTMITMFDGSSKRIEDIVENDAVLSKDCIVSICSDERVKTPNIMTVYGINDEPACFTPEHALLTPEGWKSLDPEKSNKINPHFNVTLLTCGDFIYKLCGFKDGVPDIRLEEVKQIYFADVSDKQVYGYDLHFREGAPAYFANGILCQSDYPEITCARIIRNMEHDMTDNEKICFIKLIQDNRDLFDKAFGSFIVRGFFNGISNFKI